MTDEGPSGIALHSVADVLIVGAGPAGLASAAACLNAGLNVIVLEQSPTVGGWSSRISGNKCCTGPAESLLFADANFTTSLPSKPTAQDVHAYLAGYAAYYNITDHVRPSCRVTHLNFEDASSRWKIIFQDLAHGMRCQAAADFVVLCAGHGLSKGHPQNPSELSKNLGGIDEGGGADTGTVVMLAYEATVERVSEESVTAVTIIGDGEAALECASALALLRGARGVGLVTASSVSPTATATAAAATRIDGASLLDSARRRALHAALQPHPSLPPPGPVGRVLRAPTKRRFWAYVKGRAAAVVARCGGGSSGPSEPGAAAPAAAAGAPPATTATARAGATAAMTAAGPITGPGLGVQAQLVQSHLVLWTPSFRDPRVMPFLDPALREALLQGNSQQQQQYHNHYHHQHQSKEQLAIAIANSTTDMVLYRGIMHPDVPGLAFVGWGAHAATPLLVPELQAQWLAAFLTNWLHLPGPADMRADMARQRAWRAASLTSPFMSACGSLARTHERHYVRQLLADLAGLVELRTQRWNLEPGYTSARPLLGARAAVAGSLRRCGTRFGLGGCFGTTAVAATTAVATVVSASGGRDGGVTVKPGTPALAAAAGGRCSDELYDAPLAPVTLAASQLSAMQRGWLLSFRRHATASSDDRLVDSFSGKDALRHLPRAPRRDMAQTSQGVPAPPELVRMTQNAGGDDPNGSTSNGNDKSSGQGGGGGSGSGSAGLLSDHIFARLGVGLSRLFKGTISRTPGLPAPLTGAATAVAAAVMAAGAIPSLSSPSAAAAAMQQAVQSLIPYPVPRGVPLPPSSSVSVSYVPSNRHISAFSICSGTGSAAAAGTHCLEMNVLSPPMAPYIQDKLHRVIRPFGARTADFPPDAAGGAGGGCGGDDGRGGQQGALSMPYYPPGTATQTSREGSAEADPSPSIWGRRHRGSANAARQRPQQLPAPRRGPRPFPSPSPPQPPQSSSPPRPPPTALPVGPTLEQRQQQQQQEQQQQQQQPQRRDSGLWPTSAGSVGRISGGAMMGGRPSGTVASADAVEAIADADAASAVAVAAARARPLWERPAAPSRSDGGPRRGEENGVSGQASDGPSTARTAAAAPPPCAPKSSEPPPDLKQRMSSMLSSGSISEEKGGDGRDDGCGCSDGGSRAEGLHDNDRDVDLMLTLRRTMYTLAMLTNSDSGGGGGGDSGGGELGSLGREAGDGEEVPAASGTEGGGGNGKPKGEASVASPMPPDTVPLQELQLPRTRQSWSPPRLLQPPPSLSSPSLPHWLLRGQVTAVTAGLAADAAAVGEGPGLSMTTSQPAADSGDDSVAVSRSAPLPPPLDETAATAAVAVARGWCAAPPWAPPSRQLSSVEHLKRRAASSRMDYAAWLRCAADGVVIGTPHRCISPPCYSLGGYSYSPVDVNEALMHAASWSRSCHAAPIPPSSSPSSSLLLQPYSAAAAAIAVAPAAAPFVSPKHTEHPFHGWRETVGGSNSNDRNSNTQLARNPQKQQQWDRGAARLVLEGRALEIPGADARGGSGRVFRFLGRRNRISGPCSVTGAHSRSPAGDGSVGYDDRRGVSVSASFDGRDGGSGGGGGGGGEKLIWWGLGTGPEGPLERLWGPAWAVRREVQERQDRLVAEISSRLRVALERKKLRSTGGGGGAGGGQRPSC